MSSKHLAEILIDYSKNGDLNLPIIEEALLYYPVKPSTSLLSRARKAHGDKKYNEQGNFYDLTIEELLKLIKWIVIQEDINYPPPKYEGRKMSFYRYLEAIYVACNDLYSLERVIKRTLSHRRPSKWNGVIYP